MSPSVAPSSRAFDALTWYEMARSTSADPETDGDVVEDGLGNLFGIAVVAFVVPFVAGFFPRLRVPTIVLEILAGIVVGPSVLGWLEVDDAVAFMALLGVAFLLFLAGLELDLDVLRGPPLRLGAAGSASRWSWRSSARSMLSQVGIVAAPLLVAVALCSTSVGIIVPVLRDTGNLRSEVGVYAVAGGAAAEFGSIVLLGVLFALPIGSVEYGVTVLMVGLIALLLFGIALAALLWADRAGDALGPGAPGDDQAGEHVVPARDARRGRPGPGHGDPRCLFRLRADPRDLPRGHLHRPAPEGP